MQRPLPDTPYAYEDTLTGALGMEFEVVEPERIVARMPLDHRTRQPYGVMHGGAIAALAETMTSSGTLFSIDYPREVAFGQEFSYSLLRTVSRGHVRAEAVVLHRGKTTWVWDVRVRDDEGRLVAVCRCTIAVRPNRA